MPDRERTIARQAIVVLIGICVIGYGLWYMSSTYGGRSLPDWIDRLVVEIKPGSDDIQAGREAGEQLLEAGVKAIPDLLDATKNHARPRIRGAAANVLGAIVREKSPDTATCNTILTEIEATLRKKPPFDVVVGCSECLAALAENPATQAKAEALAPVLADAAAEVNAAKAMLDGGYGLDHFGALQSRLSRNLATLRGEEERAP